jgi:predicted RecB family nuclease
MKSAKDLRTCTKGHHYYKSSDCPTCPFCEEARKPADGFLSTLVAPARRALQGIGATTVKKLAKHSEEEILKLHGMGPATVPKLRRVLREQGLSFRKKASS